MKLSILGAVVTAFLCTLGCPRPALCSFYHSNIELQNALHQLAIEYPDLASVYSIGASVTGVDLTVIKLGRISMPLGTPNVKLIGNIHGNEPLGREILLRLAMHLLNGVENGDEEALRILESVYIHILPSMNPDGFEEAQEGVCNSGPGRRNAAGVDLNRNFPSALYPDDVKSPVQPETEAIMEWMHKVSFLLSAALHGGAVVVNYPYDVAPSKEARDIQKLLQGPQGFEQLMEMLKKSPPLDPRPKEHQTEDDKLFKVISTNYSKAHGHMANMGECPGEPDVFENGIVNGAAWYPITGSMQDYNYDFHGCLEITLELSCCKYPGPHTLDQHWKDNKDALIAFLQLSQLGVKGVIRNGSEPVVGAAVSITGRKTVHHTSEHGEYWKILLPGHYYLQVEKPGFKTTTKRFVVPAKLSDNPVIVNVDMSDTSEPELMPVEIDAIEPDFLDDTNNWPFIDARGIQEYDEAWKAKVEERKRQFAMETGNTAHRSRLNTIILAVPLIRIIIM